MLKRLILHGFKSFSDRTELKLGSGITAIVGPNGCGKSNLADALRWVLGEQSTRVLRCQRLHELIFTGAASKRAMGMAEVKILLDGLGGDGEIEIARRFTRDGSSEYRLNGKICRYKDIVETLLGTGLSHLGYVVIGQGTIHELAGGKPEDRRIWIEEASGVARFHLDKKAVENNLAKAGNDIERLNDLLVELEARKAILYSHWQTAKEYKEFVDRRKNTELSMWLYQEREEARKVLSLKRRIDKYVSDYDSIQQTLSSLSSELKALEQSIEP